MNVFDGIRIGLSAILILFIPGFAWSFVFLGKREVDWPERTAISVALSMLVVPLATFAAYYAFGLGITLLNTVGTVWVVTAIPGVYWLLRRPGFREWARRKIETFWNRWKTKRLG